MRGDSLERNSNFSLDERVGLKLALLVAILGILSPPASAFTIQLGTGATYDKSDPLGDLPPNTTGTVTLNPAPTDIKDIYLAPPQETANIFIVFAADAPTQFADWTAVPGVALKGTLTITEYDARDYKAEPRPPLTTPRGGADMRAIFTRDAGDPTPDNPAIADLQFINLFTDNTGASGALASHIDPFPNDDTLPWYYTETEAQARQTATTFRFEDSPSDKVTTIPFNRTVRFETYLATFDNTTKVATIHDGWSWGYDVVADRAPRKEIPEPSTVLGTTLVLGFGALFKRVAARKPQKSQKSN